MCFNKNNLCGAKLHITNVATMFFCLSLYIFSEWHIMPMLKIQIKP